MILYALSVGASEDALNADDLPLTYELGSEPLRVLPSFAVLFGFGAMGGITSVRWHLRSRNAPTSVMFVVVPSRTWPFLQCTHETCTLRSAGVCEGRVCCGACVRGNVGAVCACV